MVVIDWLQTSEFIRRKKYISFKIFIPFVFYKENSERFALYCLCGCFIGITIILFTVIIVLYIEKHPKTDQNDYQIPRTDHILSGTRSYIPVYRYDGRTDHAFYNV